MELEVIPGGRLMKGRICSVRSGRVESEDAVCKSGCW